MSHHTNNANNTNAPPTNGPGTQPGASQPALEKTYFEAQREMLVLEIAQVNINPTLTSISNPWSPSQSV
jgi:hypothetical protein